MFGRELARERAREGSKRTRSVGWKRGREEACLKLLFRIIRSSPLSSSVPPPLLPSSPLRDDVILIINKCAPQIRPKGRHVSPDGAKIVGGWRAGVAREERFNTFTYLGGGTFLHCLHFHYRSISGARFHTLEMC